MIQQRVEAIYEGGMLRLLTPVNLAEHERVSVVIGIVEPDKTGVSESNYYLPLIAEEGGPDMTWEQIQSALANLPGSLEADFDLERDERF